MVIRTSSAARRAPAASPARARQERAREHARREILLAAGEVFARRGYAASTLADLAQAAGYAAPSLYRYFASKEEIFRSLIGLLKAELAATFDAPVDRSRPAEARLEALLARQIELGRSRRQVFAFLMTNPPQELAGHHPLAEYRVGASLYEGQMAAWMARHVDPSELRCPVLQAARTLAAVAHAFHHAFILDPAPGLEPAEEAHRVVDLALHGIAATPAAGPRAGRRGATP
ncbi:MAG: TetR/AcrR family transcriptional regulator [Anaeromyxobacter sp.]|nr:TetR/AcrR family transcriptional regulator [Anaeromyxobacter sp.]MBL0274660.1 TetR/AcrR family transcriptional regulator [Anaeromyxobacter sp.]